MDRTLTCAAICLATLTACGGGGASIGGTVSGLASGTTVTLQDNGNDTLAVAANGTFTFQTDVLADGTYAVTVVSQPVGQPCTLTNGAGAVDASADPVTNIAVSCLPTP